MLCWFRSIILCWFRDYLTDRKHYTVIGDNANASTQQSITCGVPQGSVLGPVLFLIYINDMINASPDSKIRLFADDTNVFLFDTDLSKLCEA